MDISAKEHTSGMNKPGTIATVVSGIVTWLLCFFTLTEEELWQAGIHISKYGRDE
jgi:hypothetical protein